jgi:hypothetical protein
LELIYRKANEITPCSKPIFRIYVMKTILKILFLCGIIVLTACSCEKEDIPEWSDFVEGYIVGTFKCDETDGEVGQATGSKTDMGYCILLEGSENMDSPWPIDIYTLNLPSELYDFPPEIHSVLWDHSNCGPVLFPDSLKNEYKLGFKYRNPKESERIFFSCGPCTAMGIPFPWKDYNQVILKNISKINQ